MAKEQETKEKDVEIESVKLRDIMRADDLIPNTNVSNFEYVFRKVVALQEEIELMQRILEQNNLKYTLEARANNDIEAKTWKLLNLE
jgi:hypothetical protein